MDLVNSGYGHKLFEADIPSMVRSLKKIADEMEKLNKNLDRIAGASNVNSEVAAEIKKTFDTNIKL